MSRPCYPAEWRGDLDAARAIPEPLKPSEWSERYRVLSPVETHQPGPWRNDVFPYLTPIMDAAGEAVEKGKQGVVLMKSGQGGGTQAVLNIAAWARVMLPGPQAYVLAKEEQAREMARDRISPMIDACEPLRVRALRGRSHGELIHRKRFVDGPWSIVGGRAVTNLEAQPYRVVIFDEIDSIQDEYVGKGDPLENALIRMASFSVPTLAVVLAHPTTADRGAGKLYYHESDQRRAFAPCAHCGSLFWLQREHVRCLPRDGETMAAAESRPDRYVYVAPCCGAEVSDADRWWMAERTEQRSTLPPEVAATKRWIGTHFSWFYMRNKSLEELAYNWIKTEGKPGERRVVVNKQDGDVWREAQREANPDAWRACIVFARRPDDPEVYALGQVAPWMQFLTAGQDSRQRELHWAVWGWGYRRDEGGIEHLVGGLVDCGVIERTPTPTIDMADLMALDEHVYDRAFERVGADGHSDGALWVAVGLHDSGWQPIAVYRYCLRRPDRAWPSKGAAEDDRSAAPPIRLTRPPPFVWEGEEFREAPLRFALLNSYALKTEMIGMVERGFVARGGERRGCVVLPVNTPDRFIAESASESLVRDATGKKWVWRARGPNHFADCNHQALAAALELLRGMDRETREEQVERERATRRAAVSSPPRPDGGGRPWAPPGSGWWTGMRR